MMVDLSHCGQRDHGRGNRGILTSGRDHPQRLQRDRPAPPLQRRRRTPSDGRRRGRGRYLPDAIPDTRPGASRERTCWIISSTRSRCVAKITSGIGSDLSTTPIDGSDEYWSRHREFVAGTHRTRSGRAERRSGHPLHGGGPELPSADGTHRGGSVGSRGHSDERIAKVIGGNWVRLFGELWQA